MKKKIILTLALGLIISNAHAYKTPVCGEFKYSEAEAKLSLARELFIAADEEGLYKVGEVYEQYNDEDMIRFCQMTQTLDEFDENLK